MINDLNPENLNLDFSKYDQSSSIYCSQLSLLTYRNEVNIEKFYQQMVREYPDQNINYNFLSNTDKNDTQALLWCNKTFLAIAFRGTERNKLKDWITNIKFWNYNNNPESNEELENLPPGHAGFRRSAMNLITTEHLLENINSLIKKSSPDADFKSFPIILTGHSLGAAISQMLIEPLVYSGYSFSGAYHFAPPLAVSNSVRDYMKDKYGEIVHDIVYYKDYVPRAGRNGVSHFGKFYRICLDGKIYKEKERYVRFKRFEVFKQAKWHSLTNHISAIKDTKHNSFERIQERESKGYKCL